MAGPIYSNILNKAVAPYISETPDDDVVSGYFNFGSCARWRVCRVSQATQLRLVDFAIHKNFIFISIELTGRRNGVHGIFALDRIVEC